MKKKLKIVLGAAAGVGVSAATVASALVLTGHNGSEFKKTGIPTLDLSVKPQNIPDEYAYLYSQTVVDDQSSDYLAHPDSVLLDSGALLQVYPIGHGRGAIQSRLSYDGGLSYTGSIEKMPESWKNSLETPTVYMLDFTDGSKKLILISANPDWGEHTTPGGFHCSISDDDGCTWTEFERFYGKDEESGVIPIVTMASLTRLKENGEFVDKWMGFFHDSDFYNYKTILTFDEQGKPQWSVPEKYFEKYRAKEECTGMCEVEVIRSDRGRGDELCLLTRSNSKAFNSLISFSSDEGQTWSEPKELPSCLNGERMKAEYAPDGRLVIVFRSIERDNISILRAKRYNKKLYFGSEGLIMWVGSYDDLKNGSAGQYRIKLAHVYYEAQKKPGKTANADTGYCGNTVLPDGTFVISSYGKFSPDKSYIDKNGKKQLKTYIMSKRIKLSDLDALYQFLHA